jgi:hypothetical protein
VRRQARILPWRYEHQQGKALRRGRRGRLVDEKALGRDIQRIARQRRARVGEGALCGEAGQGTRHAPQQLGVLAIRGVVRGDDVAQRGARGPCRSTGGDTEGRCGASKRKEPSPGL